MIGFGEAARAFVSGWRSERHFPIRAYDIKSHDPAHRPAMIAAWSKAGVEGHDDLGDALRGADLVVCLVTADQALSAAQAASPYIAPGLLWLDGNSASPGTKRRASAVIASGGGHYVDMTIMAPVQPRLHRTPILLSGQSADTARDVLGGLGMNAEVAGGEVGDAAAVKMLRSVMIKGIEALTAECLLAARRAGVERAVLASLQNSDPEMDWIARSTYNLERMRVHGIRRSAEMKEVAATLRDLGLPDRMATAAAEWQQEIGVLEAGGETLEAQLDSILARMK
jgi:3-hydroxyisobutyrate dehydrogenase-like beta-hydroxyacid dehydrogenase